MMDFTLPERSQAVADLAAGVLRGEDPWKELARAGLLDVSPPDGLGVLEVSVLHTEIGRRAPSMQPLATLMTVPKHKGITILIVDTRDPGFSWTPIITHDGAHHVNATYYAGVRVPARMRVGAENEGWRLVTTQLNHERVMLGPAGRIAALHHRVRAWAAGRDLLAEPGVRRALARASAVMRVNELLNWHVASAPTLDVADASVTKVFSSEQLQVIGPELAEVVGRHADDHPATADLMTWLDTQLKRTIVLTFGGGVNEIQRELIATAGLGLPRAPR